MTGLDVLKQILNQLRLFLMKGSINSEYEITCLKQILDKIITFIPSIIFDELGYKEIQRVTINKNLFGGRNESIKTTNYLKYPPSKNVNYGRANLKGQSILYATFNHITALNEMKPNVGDLITISTWDISDDKALSVIPIFKITSKNMIAHNLLSLQFLNEYEKVKKTLSKDVAKQSDELMTFIAECFAKEVEYDNKYDYFMSAYFADRIFTGFNVDAIVYPSVPEDLGFSNIAIRPHSFDSKYFLSKVEECYVVESPRENGHSYQLRTTGSTDKFNKDEILW